MPKRAAAGMSAGTIKISRTKIEMFLECRKCFWLDIKQGIKRPSGPPFTLNNAVDFLLKEEFDVHRAKGTKHPVMQKFEIEAIPFAHEKLNQWRHNFTGVQFEHAKSGFLVTGAVDDIWTNPQGELIVVDYKATGAKEHKIYDSYRHQMEVYQWLLRQNGFAVSTTGYFVFARVNKASGFGNGEAALAFDLFIEPLVGDDSWIEQALMSARATLEKAEAPDQGTDCQFCDYRTSAARIGQ